ncbi:MAG: hypothetical protein R2856_18840 [Caldilineaceae bacterium]
MITNTATVTAPGVFAGTHTDVAVLEVAELGALARRRCLLRLRRPPTAVSPTVWLSPTPVRRSAPLW